MIDSILEEYRNRIIKVNNENDKKSSKWEYIFFTLYNLSMIISFVLNSINDFSSKDTSKKKMIASIIFTILGIIFAVSLKIVSDKKALKYQNDVNKNKLNTLKSILKENHLYTKRRMTELFSILDKLYPYKKFNISKYSPFILVVLSLFNNPTKKIYKYLNNDLKLSALDIANCTFWLLVIIILIFLILFSIYQFWFNRKVYIKRFKSDLQYLIITMN